MLYSDEHERLLINFLENTSINKLYVSDSMFACRDFNDLHDFQKTHRIHGSLPQVHENIRVMNKFDDTALISHDQSVKQIKQSDYVLPYLMNDPKLVSPEVLHSLSKRIQVGFFADDPNLNLLVESTLNAINKNKFNIEVTPKDQESVLKRNFNFKPYTNPSNPHNVYHRNISRIVLMQLNNIHLRSLSGITNQRHAENLIDFYKETMPPERYNRLGKDLLEMMTEPTKGRLKRSNLALTSMWASEDFNPIILPNAFPNKAVLDENKAYVTVKNAKNAVGITAYHIDKSLKDLFLNVFKYINHNGKKTLKPSEIKEVFESNLATFGKRLMLQGLAHTMSSVTPKIVDNPHFSRESFHKNLAETIKLAYELTDTPKKPTTLISDFVNNLKTNIDNFIIDYHSGRDKIPWEELDARVKFSVAHDIINSFVKHNMDDAKKIEPLSGWAITLQECKDLIRDNFNFPKQSVRNDLSKELIDYQQHLIDKNKPEDDHSLQGNSF